MRSIRQLDLNQTILNELLAHFEKKQIQVDQELVYRGHIPSVGFVLLDGLIVAKNTRASLQYDKGAVIGVKELLEGDPLKYSIEVKSGSNILIIDRSSLLELSTSGDQRSKKIFSEIMA